MGRSGALWVMWKNNFANPFCLDAIYKVSRFVVYSIKLSVLNLSFVVIFLYAYASSSEKDLFWNETISYTQALELPYILIGEFIELRFHSDKQGGIPVSLSRLDRMNEFRTN